MRDKIHILLLIIMIIFSAIVELKVAEKCENSGGKWSTKIESGYGNRKVECKR